METNDSAGTENADATEAPLNIHVPRELNDEYAGITASNVIPEELPWEKPSQQVNASQESTQAASLSQQESASAGETVSISQADFMALLQNVPQDKLAEMGLSDLLKTSAASAGTPSAEDSSALAPNAQQDTGQTAAQQNAPPAVQAAEANAASPAAEVPRPLSVVPFEVPQISAEEFVKVVSSPAAFNKYLGQLIGNFEQHVQDRLTLQSMSVVLPAAAELALNTSMANVTMERIIGDVPGLNDLDSATSIPMITMAIKEAKADSKNKNQSDIEKDVKTRLKAVMQRRAAIQSQIEKSDSKPKVITPVTNPPGRFNVAGARAAVGGGESQESNATLQALQNVTNYLNR